MSAEPRVSSEVRPGLIAGFLAGPASKQRQPNGLARWLLLPLIVFAAAIDGAHQVRCPSRQGLARLALARRMAGHKSADMTSVYRMNSQATRRFIAGRPVE